MARECPNSGGTGGRGGGGKEFAELLLVVCPFCGLWSRGSMSQMR